MAARALQVSAVQVRVTLRHIRPPVWRDLILPGHWHLGQVHGALQIAFDWYEAHLHEFQVGDRSYGEPDPFGMREVQRETLIRLHEVLRSPGDKITYWYDFGDDWFHDVVVKEVLEPQREARCLKGRRAAPPEDSGGPWGYQRLLEVLADPKDPDYADMSEWVGGTFDPELVDVAGIDSAVRALR